ncbi:T9SS type A sorting domain-containing protein [Adhaeribacter sp. BT258]|uniref:T9SS type A sorting domain-containing protein n=1 Tax=Adhaeribacter terrigena TaxID=2793070 RepID=A0ABS1C2P8_9BACT|nr:T9SS type A sorting domain-containing protein [Adhaeribacter terrigena]MBK0403675.1 T9SS type A sorting domain-containing protein [Adhaeribacter terrigena]
MQNSTKHPRKIYQQNATNYQQKKHMRFSYRIYLLLGLFLSFTAVQAWATTFVSNGGGTVWGSAASWTRSNIDNGNTSPGAGDIVTIQAAHKIKLTSDAVCGSLTIENSVNNDTSRLKLAGFDLTLSNITFSPGMGNRRVRLIFGSGTLKVSGAISVTGTPGNLALDYTPASTIEFNGTTAQTLSFNTSLRYPNVVINNAFGVTSNGAITAANVSGNFIVQGGKFSNGGFDVTGAPGKTFEVRSGATYIATGATTFPTGFTNYTLSSGSTFEYAGTGQTIASRQYSNLKVSGTGTKTLAGSIVLDRAMTISNGNVINLINGSITLGDHPLTVEPTGSIINTSATNYIKQTGSGKLIIEGIAGGSTTEVMFPVGSANAYTPAYIINTGDIGGSGNYSVLVTPGINGTSGQAVSNLVAKRTWNVDRVTGSGSADITLRLQWDPTTDEGIDFVRTNVGIAHFTGGTWQQPPLSSFSDGSLTYSATLQGISSFSPFGVVNPNNPLPVELISFKATKKDNAAYLQWVTASEKENQGFHIQHSNNGRNFEDIGFVASQNPNSATRLQYDFLDKTTTQTGLRYYRLKQVDLNGTVSFSDIKVVNFEAQPNAPVVYPNPFTQEINFSIQAGSNEEISYQIIDLTGKTLYKNTQKLIEGNNSLQINFDKEHPAGFYLLRTQTSSGTTSTRLIRQ